MKTIVKYYDKEPTRGRPRNHQSYATMSVLSSIARISAKHNLDPRLLLDALAKAWAYEESQCGKLEVKCRKIDHDLATFLITCNDKVVCQFFINIDILQKPEFFKPYIPIISPSIQDTVSPSKNIGELKAKMRGVTIHARIVEAPPRKLVNTRYGWEAYVSNVLLADKTGTIRLSLWNNQINNVAVGDIVNIEKASVDTFYGELQLRIGRSGTITIDTSARELATV